LNWASARTESHLDKTYVLLQFVLKMDFLSI
jgi:hypothetical protein